MMLKRLLLVVVILYSTLNCGPASVKQYFKYNEFGEIVKVTEVAPATKLCMTKSDTTTKHQAMELNSDSRFETAIKEFKYFMRVAAGTSLYLAKKHKDFFVTAFNYAPTSYKIDFVIFSDNNDGLILAIHLIQYLNGEYYLFSYKPEVNQIPYKLEMSELKYFKINYDAYRKFINTGTSLPYLK